MAASSAVDAETKPLKAPVSVASAARHRAKKPTQTTGYPTLAHLIALKLDTRAPRDEVDVVDVLRQNPDADIEAIRATCKKYGLDKIDDLIDYARSGRR